MNDNEIEELAELLWHLDGYTGDFKAGIKTAWRTVVNKYFENAGMLINAGYRQVPASTQCAYCGKDADAAMLNMGNSTAHAECVIKKLNELLDPDYEGIGEPRHSIQYAEDPGHDTDSVPSQDNPQSLDELKVLPHTVEPESKLDKNPCDYCPYEPPQFKEIRKQTEK